MFQQKVFGPRCWSLCVLLVFPATNWAIDPVRPGDQIEVKHLRKWIPGEVVEYGKGQARVRYTFIREHVEVFKIEDMRFPNNEGNWMIWKDATGKFQIPARLVGRTATHVKLIKEDGKTVEVPIAKLAANLKLQLDRMVKAEKDFVDAAFVRVGDRVEYKKFSTWYPANVKELLATGAKIEYDDGHAAREADAKYEDMRYPNGEGPWVDWTDITGQHKVKARYMTHDATHVELLIEGGRKVRMERTKLAKDIETGLAGRAIVTRRPEEVQFDMSRVDYDDMPSWTKFGTSAPAPSSSLAGDPLPTSLPELTTGHFSVPLKASGKIDAAILVDGPDGWLALGITPETIDATHPVSLQWVNLKSQTSQPGPNFFEGEVVVGYSAAQQRLLTAEGLDVRGSASRFCTYRLAPGGDTATPEWKWSVPSIRFYSSRDSMNASFVGTDQVLIGYGGTLTMWNLTSKIAEYAIPSTESQMNFSPNGRHFITNQFSHAVVIDTQSGEPVANLAKGSTAHFTQDGNHIDIAGTFSESVLDLQTSESQSISSPSRGFSKSATTGSPAIIDQRWLAKGGSLFDLQSGWLIWTEGFKDLQPVMRQVVNDKVVAIGSQSGIDGLQVVVGVSDAVNPTAVSRISTIAEAELYVLRPGIRVRVDASIGHPQVIAGIQRAIAVAGWQEDPSAEIVIKASAERGETQTRSYSQSRFAGFGGSRDGSAEQTVSANPWMQYVTVELHQQPLWSTGGGGIPGFLAIQEGESLQDEVRKCEVESYSLFNTFEFPEKVMAAKWRNGFGTTSLAPDGFVELPVE